MPQTQLTLDGLQQLMVRQLKRRGFYSLKETEILLRLVAEVGEVCEAVREKQSKMNLSYEMVDVLWMLLILAEKRKISLSEAFLEKLRINEGRKRQKKNI